MTEQEKWSEEKVEWVVERVEEYPNGYLHLEDEYGVAGEAYDIMMQQCGTVEPE